MEREGISKMKDVISEKMKIESMKHITKKTGLATLKDPEFFYVPLSQHIGQMAKETVSKGDYVHRYEKIGEISGKVSSMVHSPVSGKVIDIVNSPIANGKEVKTVVIRNDFQYKEIETEKRRIEEVGRFRRDELLEIIKQSGIVGEGGAQFPTYVKYGYRI